MDGWAGGGPVEEKQHNGDGVQGGPDSAGRPADAPVVHWMKQFAVFRVLLRGRLLTTRASNPHLERVVECGPSVRTEVRWGSTSGRLSAGLTGTRSNTQPGGS